MYFLGYVHLLLCLLVSVCLFEHAPVCMCVYMCVCVHVCVCVCVCVCVVSLFIILSFNVQNTQVGYVHIEQLRGVSVASHNVIN